MNNQTPEISTHSPPHPYLYPTIHYTRCYLQYPVISCTHSVYTFIYALPLATPFTPSPHHVAQSLYPHAPFHPHTQPDLPDFPGLWGMVRCLYLIKKEQPLRSENIMRNKGQGTRFGYPWCRRLRPQKLSSHLTLGECHL